ncbi:mechanosensitive ion channel family protein [Flagellimonas allohymeniacidonis]|uniref:Mechanosensitive ion channel n=1 Tax=Flagellimonas allohymeniacidonis TaxID=2517819 RepID=A0A4V2HSX1_9FLAO|nr:mechanosensitive ion channel domain-containing protein [Allomuricauda hymeniacidonis]TAI49440.1 mechanosensitive ion channel [Allomuricauda hymeniacidonis]
MQEGTEEIKEIIQEDIWGSIKDFLNLGIHLGEGEKSIHLTIGLLLLLIFSIVVTKVIMKWLRSLFTRKMDQEDKRRFSSVFKFINYVIYLAVVLITLSAAGINITLLITASAALFVGLGLALQELFKDILGGIFIILDKSLQVGDVVNIEGRVCKVFEIKLRTTRALTRDDKVMVIPNHKFISDTVFNHTQNHSTTRENVQVGVAYGSDVELVTKILEEAASEQRQVLKEPKPFVLFRDFGDSALLFSVHFFIKDSFGDLKIKSDIRYAINTKFKENNITIPFPQRDVHIFQNLKPQSNKP